MAKLNTNSKRKELKRILDSKIRSSSIELDKRLQSISGNIELALLNKEEKIKKLIYAIDCKFPPSTSIRGLYDGISTIVFDTAYALYLLNNNSALIIELHGILERFCINALRDILPIDDVSKSIISELLDKKTLKDIAKHFETLSVWTSDDVEFSYELTKLRNGIAHKNAELVSRSKLTLSDGQSRHPESIHQIMHDTECSSFIARTAELIIKASGLTRPSFIKQPRLYARYNLYSSVIGELYNLFITNPYVKRGDPFLETYINNRIAPLYIIASEKLVEHLQTYRKHILLFHESLNTDNEGRALEEYEQLKSLLGEITQVMRIDLNVDNNRREWITEPSIIDISTYLKDCKKESCNTQ
jgi:hypothetical protein